MRQNPLSRRRQRGIADLGTPGVSLPRQRLCIGEWGCRVSYREKRFANLQAEAALISAELVKGTNDREEPCYQIHRWALTATFTTLEEVEQWLNSFGTKQGAA